MHAVNVEPMVNKHVIRLVESLLDDARNGKLRSMYFAGLSSENEVMMGHSGLKNNADKFRLIGYLLSDAGMGMAENVTYEEL